MFDERAILLGTAAICAASFFTCSQPESRRADGSREVGGDAPQAGEADTERGAMTEIAVSEEKLPLIRWKGEPAPAWKEVERLVDEQKLEAASAKISEILEDAKRRGDSEEWARALVRLTSYRMGLHGYETAVRFLREQPWPEDLLGRTTLELYYGQALVTYARSYSWEIRQREKVVSTDEVDLKKWTLDQIVGEAHKAYAAAFARRSQLGELLPADLREHIQPNTYPEGIRPSLRDAVSYLWVELLSDTSLWRPEHANGAYRLELGLLMGGAGGPRDPLGLPAWLANPEVHPLARIAVILGDLERWHEGEGQREAALEARLTRLRQLFASYTGEEKRAAITADLRGYLRDMEGAGLPWWAMGIDQLAQFVRQEPAPDALVRAREIALRGQKAFPDSPGGKSCLATIESIEAPAYQLSGMASDGAGKRSIGLQYKNLTKIWMRAYPVDLRRHIGQSKDWSLLPDGNDLTAIMDEDDPSDEWAVDLEPTRDYRMHRKLVVPPMKKPGLYVIVTSAREGFGRSDNVLLGLNLVLGDLVLIDRQEGGTLEANLLSGATGEPVEGAEVHLYERDWRKGHRKVETKRTGADGVARFDRRGDNYFLLATKGDQVALDPDSYYLRPERRPGEVSAALLYTDRSIYRPGQTLHWKAVAYRGREASYRTSPEARLRIVLVDANGDEVTTSDVTTNDFGSASGELVLPKGRVLGQWWLRVQGMANAPVRVEEYKRPTFEAELKAPEEALRLNRPAKLEGEARYYFGLPVTEGGVAWRVVRTPVYPWWWGWYYWWAPTPSNPETIAAGEARLDEEGKFQIAFTPEAEEPAEGDEAGRAVSYRYEVTADVTGEGGETRVASTSFRLGFVAVEAAIRMDTAFLAAETAAELKVRRTTLDGVGLAGEASWRLMALPGPGETLLPAEQPLPALEGDAARYATADDRRRQRWSTDYDSRAVLRQWKDGAELASGRLSHGEDGGAAIELPALKPGAYRLRYETKDPFGATYRTRQELIVGGARPEIALPALLLAERSSVPVGETARLLVHSGIAGQPLYLDLYRDGKRTERRKLKAGTDSALVEIPVTPELRGGFAATLWMLRDHQLIRLAATVFVPWDDKELKVELGTFRDTLRPGQKETWTVKVSRPSGGDATAAAVEVLAYMFDRSLDAFVTHSPPSPLGLYPSRTGHNWARSSLRQAQMVWLRHDGFRRPIGAPSFHVDRLQLVDGWAYGGPGRRAFGVMRKMSRRAEPTMAMDGATPPPAPQAAPPAEAEEAPAAGMNKSEADESRAPVSQAAASAPPPAEAPVELRTDFSETAFWQPHLVPGPDGSVAITFEVPDSVTSWNLWIHAISKDLAGGTLHEEARTVKELMVRPYLPRFLREGDRAALEVVINNGSDAPIKGKADFDIIDPATEESLLDPFGVPAKSARGVPFRVEAGRGKTLTFPITTPARLGMVAFKVTARASETGFSDGELRPLPVLPGRMHLMQSRFVVLKPGAVRKELTFADMAKEDDPSRIDEQLVLTVDGQLFYSILDALPYLVEYPYECTEQLLNRFLSTGILTSMFERYPAVAKMARKLAERDTRYESWDDDDPNRKMALVETPWLQQARGEDPGPDRALIKVLDPGVAQAHRRAAMAKLRKTQTSLGAFPWFPGGPPSPYITLYVLYGFSKAVEFGVDVPKDVVVRAFSYMHRHYLDELVRDMQQHDCCWHFVTFLNYVLSNFPDTSWTGGVFTDAERAKMLDFSFAHWKQHAPYLKGYLALTLHRMDRKADATLVWDSVMDSAKSDEELGTYWAPEDRSWLWYNDTIETHAFAIRTEMELAPKDPKLEGLVQWIFLNKKLNHWKSTRATAEVLYSVAHYLRSQELLGAREETAVTVGGHEHRFVFDPDEYTGKKNQVVVSGSELDPRKDATTVVEKKEGGTQFASATWHFSTEKMPAEAKGDLLKVTRQLYRRVKTGREIELQPVAEGAPAEVKVGEELEMHISLRAGHEVEYVHLRDPRAAGCEPTSQVSRYRWDLGIAWYEEIRDSGTNFFFEQLPVGEYTFKYRVRAAIAGTYKLAPATVQPMYAPEFAAYSAGQLLKIAPADE